MIPGRHPTAPRSTNFRKPRPEPGTALISALDVSSHQGWDLTALIQQFQPEHVVCKLYLPVERIPATIRIPTAPDFTVRQAESARANGCTVGGYVWCYRDVDPELTVHECMETAQRAGITPSVLWLDAEPYAGTYPDEAWLARAVDVADGLGLRVGPGIYTGAWFWRGYLGNTTRFADRPLWAAHYNGVADLEVPLFGGWTHCDAHQYTSDPVDRNVFLASVAA